jgi:L-rhamnose 1-dehydrogenase
MPVDPEKPAPVALVTGSSRGIGRATALALSRAGYRVGINHPGDDGEAAAAVAAEIASWGGEAAVFAADVATPADIDTLFARLEARWGPPDVLVNNAGICPLSPFFDIDVALWDRVHVVNLRGAFLCAQRAAAGLLAAGKPGRIINISSISAFRGGSLQVHYGPSKGGLVALTAALAVALGPHGITCNAVLPGTIVTDMNREFLADATQREALERQTCLGRLGTPEDVAAAVVFLASDQAAYITGATLLVDGGEAVKHL